MLEFILIIILAGTIGLLLFCRLGWKPKSKIFAPLFDATVGNIVTWGLLGAVIGFVSAMWHPVFSHFLISEEAFYLRHILVFGGAGLLIGFLSELLKKSNHG